MERKNLTSILTLGLLCTILTGCTSNSVKADTYVAELPDGNVIVLDQEDAEAIQQVQEELGITQEDIEKFNADFLEDETEENDEEIEEVVEKQEIFNLSKELGSKVGTTNALGIKYEVYENGAVIETIKESFATIPEEIEYEGAKYPVIGLNDVHDEWSDFTIPSHIKFIGKHAFQGSSITYLDIPDTVIYMSGDLTFISSSIEEISFPNNLKTDTDWDRTFEHCTNLKSIVIPNDVISLHGTFESCTNLTNVQLPSTLEELGSGTFKECTNLTELSLPNNLTSITGSLVFCRCGVKNIELPNSLIEVDLNAFTNCNLEEILIPDSVTTYTYLGNIETEGCPNLKKIKYSNSVEYNLDGYRSFDDACDSELTIIFPDTITDLGENHFKQSSSRKITIQVPANTVEYFQNKFPAITVIAKE